MKLKLCAGYDDENIKTDANKYAKFLNKCKNKIKHIIIITFLNF
jgi:hypothetical protein